MKTAILIISIYFLTLSILFLIKNEITHRNMRKVLAAIAMYHISIVRQVDTPEEFKAAALVWFEDMRPYRRVLLDLTTWTARGVLPPDKYEIIEPYIKGITVL